MTGNAGKRPTPLVAAAACITLAAGLVATYRSGVGCADAGQPQSRTEPAQQKEKPIVIWFHNGANYPLESLTTALSSGLVNHVMILYLHRADADWRAKPEVVEAIKAVKKSGVKLIWSRTLWPSYNIEGIRPEVIFEPNYYIREIQSIRAEAAQMGADFVALDTEPYVHSPMLAYTKKQIILKASEVSRVKSAIEEATKATGKVDFVYPEGYPGNPMPYDALAELGTYRISEGTFYCNYNTIKGLKAPYEIFGAYVNTARDNPKHPPSPFFTARQIFEESELWSGRKGLFLYPKEDNVLAVSRQLAAYARSLPRADSVAKPEANSP